MSDEEVLCSWMQPRPEDGLGEKVETTAQGRWWFYSYEIIGGPGRRQFKWEWHADSLEDLNKLREIEARLTDEEWKLYARELAARVHPDDAPMLPKDWVHASADDKKAALASVRRRAL